MDQQQLQEGFEAGITAVSGELQKKAGLGSALAKTTNLAKKNKIVGLSPLGKGVVAAGAGAGVVAAGSAMKKKEEPGLMSRMGIK